MTRIWALLLLGAASCGVPTAEATNCNSVTCAGCCTPGGSCNKGDSDAACGKEGALCVNCAGGESCDSTGRCMARIGEACTANDRCLSGFCSTVWPGAMCTTASCTSSSCPPASTCFGNSTASACVKTCRFATDCRPEYMCIALLQTNSMSVCWPDCRRAPSWCTSTGLSCNTSNGLCR